MDTNLSSWPIYKYLTDERYDVFVVGSKPEDFLAKISENYFCQDYRDLNSLNKLIESHGFDYVIPGCNDVSYEICTRLSQRYEFRNFDSIESCRILNNKKQFREFALLNGIPVPRLIVNSKKLEFIPVIIKPVDSYSGNGITKLFSHDRTRLENAINLARSHSPSGQYVIEEYVEGQLFSHSAFIKSGKILLDFFVEEHCTIYPFAVDSSRVTQTLSESVRLNLRKSIELISDLLNLKDGLIHTQFITKGHDYWLIEITRRCPGDLYSLLIKYSTGYEYEKMYVDALLGNSLEIKRDGKNRFIVRHTVTSPIESVFKSLAFKEKTNLVESYFLLKSGEKVFSAPRSRIGIFFHKSDSLEEQKQFYEKLIGREVYTIEFKI